MINIIILRLVLPFNIEKKKLLNKYSHGQGETVRIIELSISISEIKVTRQAHT